MKAKHEDVIKKCVRASLGSTSIPLDISNFVFAKTFRWKSLKDKVEDAGTKVYMVYKM